MLLLFSLNYLAIEHFERREQKILIFLGGEVEMNLFVSAVLSKPTKVSSSSTIGLFRNISMVTIADFDILVSRVPAITNSNFVNNQENRWRGNQPAHLRNSK